MRFCGKRGGNASGFSGQRRYGDDAGDLPPLPRRADDAPGGKQCYWDDVPLTHYNDEFYIEPRPCKEGDIIEIDTLSELIALDPVYRMP